MTRIFTEIIGKNFLKTVRPYIELLTKSFSIFERIYYYESEVKGIQCGTRGREDSKISKYG